MAAETPFGLVGAVWGHIVMGLDVTLMSMFGLIAVPGVVVNDSLIMVAFINRRRERHVALATAVLEAGVSRGSVTLAPPRFRSCCGWSSASFPVSAPSSECCDAITCARNALVGAVASSPIRIRGHGLRRSAADRLDRATVSPRSPRGHAVLLDSHRGRHRSRPGLVDSEGRCRWTHHDQRPPVVRRQTADRPLRAANAVHASAANRRVRDRAAPGEDLFAFPIADATVAPLLPRR